MTDAERRQRMLHRCNFFFAPLGIISIALAYFFARMPDERVHAALLFRAARSQPRADNDREATWPGDSI